MRKKDKIAAQPKIKILFIPGSFALAHVVRLLVLAKTLDTYTYHIMFACSEMYKNLIIEAKLHYYPIKSMLWPDVQKRMRKGMRVYRTHEIKTLVEAELELFKENSPDLVIGDARPSLGISADVANIPYITITNAYWSIYSVQDFEIPNTFHVKFFGYTVSNFFFSFLKPVLLTYNLRPFNVVRRSYRLAPLNYLKEIFSYGTWCLFADIPDIAFTHNLPKNHQYIGPIFWEPECGHPDWWNKLPNNRPIVYVTMGSTGEVALLNKMVKALKIMNITVILATAGRIKLNHSDNHVYEADFLPGNEAARLAQLVICNGGCTTAYQALSNGIPIIGIPSNIDQIFSMRGIEKFGAGILLKPHQASGKNIRRAVSTILDNPNYKESAQKVQKKIAQYNSTDRFINFINSI